MEDLLFFVEEIMVKYGLEKDLIENDADLKKMLSEVKDIPERVFIKFFFSNKIENYEKQGLPVDIPSIKLKGIIERLIDKKISLKDLPNIIQDELRITLEISEKISRDIEKNKEIVDEINTANPLPEKSSEEEKVIDVPKKSIGLELLK